MYAHYTRDIQWLCGHNFSLFWPPPKYLDVDILNLERGQKLAFLDHLKVSKSQKHFSWNSIAQKTNIILDKILPYEARAEFWPKFRSFFGQWSFKKKCFWDLLTFTTSLCPHSHWMSPNCDLTFGSTVLYSQLNVDFCKNNWLDKKNFDLTCSDLSIVGPNIPKIGFWKRKFLCQKSI